MKFGRFLKTLGAAAVLGAVFCSCGRSDNKLVMVAEATFPPYEFREGDRIVGIDVDIMTEVAREIGKELVVEDMSFDSVISAVQSGKADVAASGITVTEDRKRQIDFSVPYVEARQVIIVPGNSAIKGRDDLKGKRIGVQHGTTGDAYVTKNIQEPERFPNGALAVAALNAGKIDVIVIDGEPAKIFADRHKNLLILPEPLTVEEYAIAIRKGNSELLEQVNRVIRQLKENGGMAAIRAKYIK